MRTIKTEQNQTIMDIATQAYGNRFAVFQIIEDNPNIYNTSGGTFSITDELAPNQEKTGTTTGDNGKQKVTRNIPNKVTSYKTDIAGGKKDQFLANENLTYITTEDGTKIFLQQ